ncbi:MAG: peptidoglycan-binding protein [Gemmatimonadaceae bacterium]|nr:peptidoglycan-binding protein [Gemmatimonadaceae bacterium]
MRNHTERLAQIEHTFACRFYHGLAQHSPCERDLQMWVLQLLVDGPREPGKETGLEQKPLANVRYVIAASQEETAPILRGTTSSNGIIGIPLWVPIAQMTLKLDMLSAMLGSLPPAPDKKASGDDAPVGVDLELSVDSDQFKDEETFVAFPLFGGNLKRIVTKVGNPKSDPLPAPDALEPDAGEPPVAPAEQDLGARQRLYNLGYGVAEPQKWTAQQLAQFVKRFQKDKKITPPSGTLDQQTIDRLRDEYGS